MTIMASFIFFLLVFVGIGIASTLRHKSNTEDYLLAGQSVKPWLVALSAIATYNSGFMFVGMTGYTYLHGLASIWIMVGFIVGDLLASLFIHKRLRKVSEDSEVLSYPTALSRWNKTDFRKLRFLGGLISILFLGAYAAAQLGAGSKALHVLFGWNYAWGAIIGTIIVVAYCFAGGIRASIWTDAAQSVVMIASMAILAVFGIEAAGGFDQFYLSLKNVSPDYLSLATHTAPFAFIGPIVWVLSWTFGGFGVVGQPHVMGRFMSMDDASNMTRTRIYYYCWYVSFFALTILVGMVSRVLIPNSGSFDAELALPTLAMQLLPDVLVGLILAGLFAAPMSTADSQILSCSASATNALYQGGRVHYLWTKLATVTVALLALAIALVGPRNIFVLVNASAGSLASAFGPLLVVYALGQKPSERLTLAMVLSGCIVSLSWRFAGLSDFAFEVMPGMIAGGLVFSVGKLLGMEYTPRSKSLPSD